MDDWGVSNWDQSVASLWSAPELSAKEAYSKTVHNFVVLNLEWLISEESLYRAGLSQLLQGEFGTPSLFFLSNLLSLFLIDWMTTGMRLEDFEAMKQSWPIRERVRLLLGASRRPNSLSLSLDR